MHQTSRIVVVSAGLRVPSSTRTVADALAREVSAAIPGADVTVIELRDHAHAIVDALLTGFPAGELEQVVAGVHAADGLIVVTPTFGASYSGLFKSFIDILDPDRLQGTPVILAATGGTERHSLMLDYALRPLMVTVGTRPVPTGIFAATADFGAGAGLATRYRRAVTELSAALDDSPTAPAAQSSSEEPAGFVPFADLLRGEA